MPHYAPTHFAEWDLRLSRWRSWTLFIQQRANLNPDPQRLGSYMQDPTQTPLFKPGTSWKCMQNHPYPCPESIQSWPFGFQAWSGALSKRLEAVLFLFILSTRLSEALQALLALIYKLKHTELFIYFFPRLNLFNAKITLQLIRVWKSQKVHIILSYMVQVHL